MTTHIRRGFAAALATSNFCDVVFPGPSDATLVLGRDLFFNEAKMAEAKGRSATTACDELPPSVGVELSSTASGSGSLQHKGGGMVAELLVLRILLGTIPSLLMTEAGSLQLRIAHSTADLHVPTLPCGNPGGGCNSQTSAVRVPLAASTASTIQRALLETGASINTSLHGTV